MKGYNSNYINTGDDFVIVEADEYDRSFLQLFPTIAVINNIEAEHLDIYGTEEEVKKAFIEFASKVPLLIVLKKLTIPIIAPVKYNIPPIALIA